MGTQKLVFLLRNGNNQNWRIQKSRIGSRNVEKKVLGTKSQILFGWRRKKYALSWTLTN